MPIPRKDQDRLLGYIDLWKERLLLSGWTVITKFPRGNIEDLEGKLEVKRIADIQVHPRYREGRINIYPVILNELQDNQKATIAHELIHIHTDPIKEVLALAIARKIISEKRADDLLEGLTETITKLVWKAYTRKRKPKKFNI